MKRSGTPLHDRIAGSFYGLLIGDALGWPVERWSAADIAGRYGRLTEMVDAARRWRPRGLHSDDGQQALALCDALLIDPVQPGVPFAAPLVDMLRAAPKPRFGLHRGTGKNFRATVIGLASGVPPDDAGQPASGNGVAMLIAPAAYVWHADLDRLGDIVIQIGRVKQRDERGIAAAGAVAFLVAHALRCGGFANLNTTSLLAYARSIEAQASSALGG